MKIGYVRVSTQGQSFDLQIDALQQAGCEKLYREVGGGARTERPVLDRVVDSLRAGDVLVIWKLDRLGRSLKHLVELVNTLKEREIGLQSLNDPIDTTTSQGRRSTSPWAPGTWVRSTPDGGPLPRARPRSAAARSCAAVGGRVR